MTNHQELLQNKSFHQGLSTTKHWCQKQLEIANNTLRPSELNPQIDIRDYNIDFHIKKEEINRLNLIKTTWLANQELALRDIHGKILIFLS